MMVRIHGLSPTMASGWPIPDSLEHSGNSAQIHRTGSLLIDVSPVGDSGDAHNFTEIVDNVYNAVITHANPPEVLVSAQLFAAGGSRIGGQAFNLRHYPHNEAIAQTLQLFPC